MVSKNQKHDYLLVFSAMLVVMIVALSIAMPTQAEQASEETFPLREALSKAYLHNPTLQAARAEYRSVQERLPQAYAGWKPSIAAEAGISNTDLDGSNFGGGGKTTTKDLTLSVNQSIFRGGQTFAEIGAAKAVIASQQATLVQAEQSILLQAATAYMDVLRDQAVLELSVNNRDVLARQREATKDRFEVGELTKTDVAQADARLARSQTDIITSRGNVNTTKALFEQLIGALPVGLLDPDLEKFIIPKDREDALQAAENQNPQLLAVTYAHHAAEKDVDDTFGELLPEIGFFSQWNRAFDPVPGLIDRQTTKSIGLTATIPLYQSGSVRSRVRQAKYTANQRYLEIVETQKQIRQEVTAAWESLQAAEAEIESRVVEVEAASIASEGVQAENEFGSRTVLDTLDAEQEYLDAQVALVIAERNRVVSTFRLLSLLGALTPESLGFDNGDFEYKAQNTGLEFDLLDLDVDRIVGNP